MNKPSMLIVDDEPRFLESLSRLFEKDFRVFQASNGEEGILTFNKNPVSMILLDLDMPVMNGLETLRRIRKICCETRVIIMTGTRCHDWVRQCADLGVQGYIEKPFEAGKLVGKIKSLLGMEDYGVLRKLWGNTYDARMAMAGATV